MSILLLLKGAQGGGSIFITDRGALVSDVLSRTTYPQLVDRGATVTDVMRRSFTRALADTGATISDSITKTKAPTQRNLVDVGASISESVLVVSGTGGIIGRTGVDSYVDGASTIFGAQALTGNRISAFTDLFVPTSIPSGEDVPYYARLPLDTAQALLAAGPVTTTFAVGCSWHGKMVDPERGSFAVVRAGGSLEPYIGEKVRISARSGAHPVSVFAYINNVADIDEATEISLTRRLFLEMGPLGLDSLPVTVEVLSE